jgi:hypothetical protein
MKQMIMLSCWKPGNCTAPNRDAISKEEIKVQIEAYVQRGLGLHKDLTEKELYVLTHVNSGMVINKYKMSKNQALQWLMISSALTDWTEDISFLSSETAKKILEIALIARKIARENTKGCNAI